MNAAPWKPSPQEAARVVMAALPNVRAFLARRDVRAVDADDIAGEVAIIGYRAILAGRLTFDPNHDKGQSNVTAYLRTCAWNIVRHRRHSANPLDRVAYIAGKPRPKRGRPRRGSR